MSFWDQIAVGAVVVFIVLLVVSPVFRRKQVQFWDLGLRKEDDDRPSGPPN